MRKDVIIYQVIYHDYNQKNLGVKDLFAYRLLSLNNSADLKELKDYILASDLPSASNIQDLKNNYKQLKEFTLYKNYDIEKLLKQVKQFNKIVKYLNDWNLDIIGYKKIPHDYYNEHIRDYATEYHDYIVVNI